MVEIGDRIEITSENENYDEYRDKIWTVERIIPYNDPAYDKGVYPQQLVECTDLPFALYEWEFEIV